MEQEQAAPMDQAPDEQGGPGLLEDKPAAGENALTPQEMKLADQAKETATKMLYENQQVSGAIVQMLKRSPDAKTVGDAAAAITKQTNDSMQGAMPEPLISTIGLFMVQEIMMIGEKLKLFQPTAEMAKAAAKEALTTLGTMNGQDNSGVIGAIDQLPTSSGGAAAAPAAAPAPAASQPPATAPQQGMLQ